MTLPSCISNVALPAALKFSLQHLVPSTSPDDFGLLRISQAASQLVLCSSGSRRSFCSCNKEVCREANSQTALLGSKLTPLYLCWSVEVGTQHEGPCVLGCVLPLCGSSALQRGCSTDVVKVLLSSLSVSVTCLQDSGQQAELGQSLEFQHSQKVLF